MNVIAVWGRNAQQVEETWIKMEEGRTECVCNVGVECHKNIEDWINMEEGQTLCFCCVGMECHHFMVEE